MILEATFHSDGQLCAMTRAHCAGSWNGEEAEAQGAQEPCQRQRSNSGLAFLAPKLLVFCFCSLRMVRPGQNVSPGLLCGGFLILHRCLECLKSIIATTVWDPGQRAGVPELGSASNGRSTASLAGILKVVSHQSTSGISIMALLE